MLEKKKLLKEKKLKIRFSAETPLSLLYKKDLGTGAELDVF